MSCSAGYTWLIKPHLILSVLYFIQCTVLYCIVLYCIVLYCVKNLLYSLYCIVLYLMPKKNSQSEARKIVAYLVNKPLYTFCIEIYRPVAEEVPESETLRTLFQTMACILLCQFFKKNSAKGVSSVCNSIIVF